MWCCRWRYFFKHCLPLHQSSSIWYWCGYSYFKHHMQHNYTNDSSSAALFRCCFLFKHYRPTSNSSLFIFLHVVLQNLMQTPNTNWWILLHSVPHMVLLLEVPHTKPIFQSSLLWWCIWCSKELQEPLTVLTNFPSLIQAIHSLKSVYQSARIGEFCSCYCGTPMP